MILNEIFENNRKNFGVSENFGHINGHNFCSDQIFFIIQKDLSSYDSCPSFTVHRRA